MAYGQFSRLSSEWLGFNEANQIDNMLMGGSPTPQKFIQAFKRNEILIDIRMH